MKRYSVLAASLVVGSALSQPIDLDHLDTLSIFSDAAMVHPGDLVSGRCMLVFTLPDSCAACDLFHYSKRKVETTAFRRSDFIC